MHIKTSLAFLFVLTCGVLAEPVPAPAPAQNSAESVLEQYHITSVTTGPVATSLARALQSAHSSIDARKDVQSAASVMATRLPSSVVNSLIQSGYPKIETTAPPPWFTGLPKDVQNNILAQQTIIDGVATSVLKITSNPAPKPTAGLMAGGAAVAGIMGAVVLL